MAKDPYGSAPPLNEFTVDHPGVLADMEAASYQAWDPRTPRD